MNGHIPRVQDILLQAGKLDKDFPTSTTEEEALLMHLTSPMKPPCHTAVHKPRAPGEKKIKYRSSTKNKPCNKETCISIPQTIRLCLQLEEPSESPPIVTQPRDCDPLEVIVQPEAIGDGTPQIPLDVTP